MTFLFAYLYITSAEGAPGPGGNVPVGATPTASQGAADGGASSHLLSPWSKMAKKDKGKKIGANSLSGSPNFSTQGESRVRAFCSLVLSNAKVRNSIKAGQKRIRRLEDSKGKQQQLVRPRLLEFEIDGGEVEKKNGGFVLEL